MRMSELSSRTQVPVATLKFYLREGLVPAGVATSPNQAQYDETHVERVRLIKALTDVGGLDLKAVARVLDVIEAPDVERLGVLGAAQRSMHSAELVELPEEIDRPAPDTRARRWVLDRGWQVHLHDPLLDDLDRAWDACDAADLGVDDTQVDGYADAVERIAAIDIDTVPADPAGAVRHVVLGTVLIDPVLLTLRRLAHQHLSVTAAPED
ncbi:MAG: MerR family transcriptional regulator [Mobilicoccus sp.]|nr:MerR family transcriptional regulator [Mobilicoccus sp.]